MHAIKKYNKWILFRFIRYKKKMRMLMDTKKESCA